MIEDRLVKPTISLLKSKPINVKISSKMDSNISRYFFVLYNNGLIVPPPILLV
jgi:hypothetical protein